MQEVFAALGLSVLERGWLSSNNVVFQSAGGDGACVVDTGYVQHAPQTLDLVSRALGGNRLARVLNTHLHSDHCGGNAALHAAWQCEVWVPEASWDAVQRWDQRLLSFESTDQRCDRFEAHKALAVGSTVAMGGACWEVVAAPGHDPEAVMFFQREHGVLISADALWEERLAIIFPELLGGDGFGAAHGALDVIEHLAPRIVIPGHGRPFTDVASALDGSRRRLRAFEDAPKRHQAYAERALTMFHMLEQRTVPRTALVAWLATTPIFVRMAREFVGAEGPNERAAHADDVVARLVRDGLLLQSMAGELQVR